jgi:6-phosphogluconolactonase (cycloisomerase 2 family)
VQVSGDQRIKAREVIGNPNRDRPQDGRNQSGWRQFMKMKVRALIGLIAVLATTGLVGCGHYTCKTTFGSSSCTPSGSGLGQGSGSGTAFFYFLDDNGVTMGEDVLDFSGSGSFTNIGSFSAPLPLGATGDGGTTVVNKQFLYIPFANNTLYAYSINATTGALTELTNSPYSVTGGNSVTSDPAGHFVFVGNFLGQEISVFAVNASDGTLTAVGLPIPAGMRPGQMSTDGGGKFLYATESFPGSVVGAFAINQTTGALTPVLGSPFPFNMSSIYGEKSGKFLLGTTGNLTGVDNHIYVFGIDQITGAIAQVSGSPFATISDPLDLAVNPNGSWVYSFNEDSAGALAGMEGYQIDPSTGALKALPSSPFVTLKASKGQFEQSGRFVFAIGAVTNSGIVTPYSADTSTGALTGTIVPLGFPGLGSFAVTDAP